MKSGRTYFAQFVFYLHMQPQVTVEVMESCENIVKLMKEKFKDTIKYK